LPYWRGLKACAHLRIWQCCVTVPYELYMIFIEDLSNLLCVVFRLWLSFSRSTLFQVPKNCLFISAHNFRFLIFAILQANAYSIGRCQDALVYLYNLFH
jgi:hypothetical protein